MTDPAISQFDALADLYQDMSDWPFRRYIETPSVMRRIGEVRGLEVLDFGCGAGTYARLLKRAGARRSVGYDPAEGMLAGARRQAEREGLEIDFVASLDAAMHGRFDRVLAVYVLPYAQNRSELERLCAQMIAPLKPGGRLLTLPIHPDYEPEPAYYERYGFRMTPADPQAPHRDGERIKLDLFYQQRYEASVEAWYWSREAIETAMQRAGAASVDWHQPSAHAVDGSQPPTAELGDYLRKPHAALVECVRG